METQNTVIQNLIEKLEARKEEYNPSYAYTRDDSNHYQSMQRAYEHAISLLRESLPEERTNSEKDYWAGVEDATHHCVKSPSDYFNQTYKAYNQ